MTSEMVVLIVVLSWFAFVFDTIMPRRKSTSYDRVGKTRKGEIMDKGKLVKDVATLILCGITVLYCDLIYKAGRRDGQFSVYEDLIQQIKDRVE